MIKLLEGIRVLECAMLPTGDQTSRLLGDLGADVIKIERPGTGDYLRELGDRITDQNSVFHLFCNRNKRSVEVNLRNDEGRTIFFELLRTADIFVDGFAGDACDKLGIGYDAQRAVKPSIIYCQANGFGTRGSYSQIPVHGYMMGAVAGQSEFRVSDDGVVTEVVDPEGLYFPGSIDGPLSTALYAALTAAAALRHRDKTGQGCYIDAAGADAVLANQSLDAVIAWNRDRITDRRNPPPPVGLDPRRRPKYTYYQTKDDKIVLLAAIEHKFWDNFCRAIDRDDLLDVQNKTFAVDFADGGKADLLDELIPVFRSRTAAEWMDTARMYDIPLCPANSKTDTLTDAHLAAREIVHHSQHPVAGPYTSTGWPAPVSGQPFDITRPAPALGEHTNEVLAEIGYSADDVAALHNRGVV
ncbi:CaiB/BaiF CoA transferase family protein [Mycolicibacterium gilvum]|uniref:L-carnitine dehydratase/bile acid-inducible protein F n=1 Tax=Mycolicibacterium gilvum TaxID=1804 RepID=A0A378SIC6_9MYCO|nr:CoA transferase [Mycolicibacterium gilvum]MCV7057767.1 CoA transferase [Mycolicibacterium gilvum]STZ41107.1 L-carnitine dehydratase/bile acid-inducible protein F [Mycolicibacterium gilvum]